MSSKIKADLVSKSGKHILEYFDRSHRYKLDGDWTKSITGVGKGFPKPEALINWQIEQGKEKGLKILHEAADMGKPVHEFVYRTRMGVKDLNDLRKIIVGHINEIKIRVAIKSAKLWMDWTDHKLQKAEVICASKKLKVAGKFDELAKKKNGLLGVVDYKTSNSIHLNHFHQAAGYRRLIKDWFKLKVDWLEIVQFKKDKPEFHVATIDKKGLWYDGVLKIEDKNMLNDMDEQFERNVYTTEHIKKYEDFWKEVR